MFSFIHAADIHLDSPLRGLAQYEGAPVKAIRGATRQALINLVELALEESVDFVLIAGDVYDGDWRDHNTGLFFAKQMSRLRDASIPVFLIAGNHDAQSVMTKSLRLPENVHAFPVKKPGTVHLESLGAAIHGQGFATKAVPQDLTASYPPAVAGAFNIGLLHTSLTGYEGHDNYAPCTVAGLKHLGYDYWALGHIHQRQCIQPLDPAIWYPGNIQGRHIRETDKKGCLLVTVQDNGSHQVDFRALDVLRWIVLDVPVSVCRNLTGCVDTFQERLEAALQLQDDRLLAVRVEFNGASAAHDSLVTEWAQLAADLRGVANDYGGERVWLEKIRVCTRPSTVEALPEDGPLASLAGVVKALKADPVALGEMVQLLEPLQSRLPLDLVQSALAPGLDDPARIVAWLDDAESLLRAAWRGTERGT